MSKILNLGTMVAPLLVTTSTHFPSNFDSNPQQKL